MGRSGHLKVGVGSLCFNPVEGACFGIDHNKNFVRIETDGFVTTIAHIDYDFLPGLVGGLVYSPKEDLYYANIATNDKSFLMTITPEGLWDVYYELPGNNQLCFMLTTDDLSTVDTQRPEKPELDKLNFLAGATDGSIDYIMPSKMKDGTEINGKLKVVSLLDGEEYKTLEANPGETIKIDYKNLQSAMHYFGLYVVYGEHTSQTLIFSKYIGNDVPKSPTDVKLDENQVTWNAVEGGVNNGYLDLDALRYRVVINDKEYGTTTGTSLRIELPDEELAVYTANIYAEANGMTSAPGVSNGVVYGHPFFLPMTIVPTADQAKMVTIIDGNEDGYYWYYDKLYESFCCDYSDEDVYNDDWLFLPPFIAKDDETKCILNFLISKLNEFYPDELIEVCYGQADKDGNIVVKGTILEPFTPTVFGIDGYQEVDAKFDLPSAGTYYIGFHWISDPLQGGMEIKNISVKADPSSAVNTVSTSDACVAGGKGEITVSNSNGSELRVWDIAGNIVVDTMVGSNNFKCSIAKGIYIVAVDNRFIKVVVK